jgi:thioredoxin-like negative regulator of GroEL
MAVAKPENGPQSVVRLNDATFSDWAERRVPLTLVLVRSAACAQSLEIEPMLEDVGRRFSGKVRLATLDMDESPEMARRHKVEALPTMLLLRDGRQVGALRGCAVSVASIGEFIAEGEKGKPGSA